MVQSITHSQADSMRLKTKQVPKHIDPTALSIRFDETVQPRLLFFTHYTFFVGFRNCDALSVDRFDSNGSQQSSSPTCEVLLKSFNFLRFYHFWFVSHMCMSCPKNVPEILRCKYWSLYRIHPYTQCWGRSWLFLIDVQWLHSEMIRSLPGAKHTKHYFRGDATSCGRMWHEARWLNAVGEANWHDVPLKDFVHHWECELLTPLLLQFLAAVQIQFESIWYNLCVGPCPSLMCGWPRLTQSL